MRELPIVSEEAILVPTTISCAGVRAGARKKIAEETGNKPALSYTVHSYPRIIAKAAHES
jgi:hypothetical protein